jgi:hypothetical protein
MRSKDAIKTHIRLGFFLFLQKNARHYSLLWEINCRDDEFCPRLSFLFLLNFIAAQKIVTTLMTPIAEALKKEHPDKKDYWQNELKSLGIEPRRQNELNDKEELQALAESIKEVYYQDYKTAYNNNSNNNNSCQGNDDKEEEEEEL